MADFTSPDAAGEARKRALQRRSPLARAMLASGHEPYARAGAAMIKDEATAESEAMRELLYQQRIREMESRSELSALRAEIQRMQLGLREKEYGLREHAEERLTSGQRARIGLQRKQEERRGRTERRGNLAPEDTPMPRRKPSLDEALRKYGGK